MILAQFLSNDDDDLPSYMSLAQISQSLSRTVERLGPIDKTIVRSVLVPASMKLLGDHNWYLPSWLEWLPKINIEGVETPEIDGAPERELVTIG